MSFKRPSHATIVAYLALLIALGTSAAWAATKITSSRQIKNGVVKGADIKDQSLTGKDVKDGGLSGADLAGESIGGVQVGNRSLRGVDLATDSVTGTEIDEASLALGQGFDAFFGPELAVDNGGGFGVPRSPQGDLVTLNLSAGRYLVLGHALLGADDNGGSVYCMLAAGTTRIETGNEISGLDHNPFNFSPAGISVSAIFESDSAFATKLFCSDANTGATAYDRGLEAVSLAP